MSEQKQLFDVQLPPPKTNRHESEYQKFKRINHYRKSEDKIIRCDNCENICVNTYSTDKYWYKCNLMGISQSPATDIRLSYVCDLFKQQTADIGFWDESGNYKEDIQPITKEDLT